MQNSTELTGQTYVYSDRAQFSSLTALLHWVTHNSTALLYRPTATPYNSLALLHCCIALMYRPTATPHNSLASMHYCIALLYRPTATPHNSLASLHYCIALRTILQLCCINLQRHHTILQHYSYTILSIKLSLSTLSDLR